MDYMQGKLNYLIILSPAQMSSNEQQLNKSSQAIAHNTNMMSKRPALPLSRSSLGYPHSQNLSDEVTHQIGKLPSLSSNFYPASRQEQQFGSESLQAGIPFYGEQNLPASYNVNSFERKQSQRHRLLTCTNIVFYVMTILSVCLVLTAFQTFPYIAIPYIGLSYICYLINGFCTNPLGQYCSNMKNYPQFQVQYRQMNRKVGNIRFKAECYHLSDGKQPKRIVTHTAAQDIPLRQCIDISSQIPDIIQGNKFILCDVNHFYCFGDEDSHNTFLNAFADFRNKSAFDLHQEYTHALDIDLPNNIGLSVNGRGQCLQPMYYLFLLMGLGCFYLHYIQCISQRYSINIKKKLTI